VRYHSDDNAGVVPRRNGSCPDPEEWTGPDVSLPPMPNNVSKAAERFSHSASNNDAAPRSPRRSPNRAKGNKSDDSGQFRHRELLKHSSHESRLPRFENKVITVELSHDMSFGDLSCASDFNALNSHGRAIAVCDKRGEKTAIGPPVRRKHPTSRSRSRSDSSHDHIGSVRDDSETAGEHVSLSGICSIWKEHSHHHEGGGGATSPCKTESTSQSDTRSWNSSDLDLDIEIDDLSDGNCSSVSRQLELQEEALIALALERSLVDVSFDADSHCSNSADNQSRSSSVNRANVQNLKTYRGGPWRKPPGPAVVRTPSQLAGAGCHLSMIANNMKSHGTKSSKSRMSLPPMLGIKRGDSSEDFELLVDDHHPSPAGGARAKPANKPGDDFVWERCPDTKRWYKRPIKAQQDKSADECMFEQVAELSMRDALKTSLGELQEVAQIRNTKHWS
jgi:hypothetical protein